jgi:hypothetical protein
MSMLLIGQYLDLGTVASYSLSMQVINVAILFSGLYMTALVPRLTWARVQGSLNDLRALLAEGWGLGCATFLAGAALILVVIAPGLPLLGARTGLLPLPILAGLLVIKFLEFNHSAVFGAFLLTRDEVPFLGAAWVSGVTISLGTLLILQKSLGGIGSILLWQGLVQLAYNNWQWPLRALRQLEIGPFDFARLGWVAVQAKAINVLSRLRPSTAKASPRAPSETSSSS